MAAHLRDNNSHIASNTDTFMVRVEVDDTFSQNDEGTPSGRGRLKNDDDFDVLCNDAISPDTLAHGSDSQSVELDFMQGFELYNDPEAPDFTILKQYNSYINSGFGQNESISDINDDMNVRLLHLLMQANTPLNLFTKIKEWAHIAASNGIDFSDKSNIRTSRLVCIKKFETKMNLDGGKPTQIEVTLRGTHQTVNVTVHDFQQQVYSLFSDPTVMMDENLIFPDNLGNAVGPFGEPLHWKDMKPSDNLIDVIDGQAYHDAWHTHVKIRGRDVLCCPIFFLDKTHVDVQGRLCIEPASFTLSIFHKEARRHPKFWRSLGLIPNQSNMHNATSLERAIDYHHMVEVIFQSVVKVQNGPGLAWSLLYKTNTYPVVWKFPVLFIIGDTEGHDKMCGKYLSRTSKVNRLCRYCNCGTDDTDNPRIKSEYTKSDDIQKLVLNQDHHGLKSISYHFLLNGFRHLTFCDNKRGINGSTPAELLHVWEKGLFLQLMSALMGLKRAKKIASKKPKETVEYACKRKRAGNEDQEENEDEANVDEDDISTDHDEECVDATVQDDDDDLVSDFNFDNGYVNDDYILSHNGVFTDRVKIEFDDYARKYASELPVTHPIRHSDIFI
jgi:hypothetical protein